MTERTIQTLVGIIFVVSQFAVLVIVGGFYIARGFTFEETTTTISIIAPIFAGYTLIIVRAIIADRNKPKATQPATSGLFAFVSLFAPLVFVAMLITIIVLRAYNVGISSFEQFKTILTSLEGIFAIYLAPIVQALFSAGTPAPDVVTPPANPQPLTG